MLLRRLLYICLLAWWACFNITAAPKEKPKAEKDSIVYHGSRLGIDLISAGKALSSNPWNVNLQYDVNLYNKYIPCLEFGYGQSDINKNQIGFSGSGFYGKLGINLPLAVYGKDAENMFFVGARYGMSFFRYNLFNTPYSAGYWNEAYTSTFMNERSLAQWGEVLGGCCIQLLPSISAGWMMRIKKLFAVKDAAHSTPPYIQGLGYYSEDIAFDFAFYLHYRLPW